MKAVVLGRCAASSAKGMSSTRTCIRMGWIGIMGWQTRPDMIVRMCVILYDEREVASSAKLRSDI
jgi:hypothetical protein